MTIIFLKFGGPKSPCSGTLSLYLLFLRCPVVPRPMPEITINGTANNEAMIDKTIKAMTLHCEGLWVAIIPTPPDTPKNSAVQIPAPISATEYHLS